MAAVPFSVVASTTAARSAGSPLAASRRSLTAGRFPALATTISGVTPCSREDIQDRRRAGCHPVGLKEEALRVRGREESSLTEGRFPALATTTSGVTPCSREDI